MTARSAEQPALFDTPPVIEPATPDAPLLALAERLRARWGARLHLGTSSWHFPGWAGTVWQRPAPDTQLSRHGLPAYARHPLLRTVSLDRAFYRPLPAAEYAALAAQTPADFRFVVKAPALLTDALLRESGRSVQNPSFLGPSLAHDVAQQAAQGLGERLGVLVLQVSPLPPQWLGDEAAWLAALQAAFDQLLPALPAGALAALELRDAALLTPRLAALLKALGVRFCLGLHDRMSPIDDQLPMLRALWPGPLVCRWNLQRGQRYADARNAWAPFDRLQAPDPPTRATLARVLRGTLDAGAQAFVIVNNKAEGSAPLSVRALAEALDP